MLLDTGYALVFLPSRQLFGLSFDCGLGQGVTGFDTMDGKLNPSEEKKNLVFFLNSDRCFLWIYPNLSLNYWKYHVAVERVPDLPAIMAGSLPAYSSCFSDGFNPREETG